MLGPTDGPHGNRRARRERVANVSLRPTEAACFRVQKCAKNRQLVVAGIQRCVQYTYSACFRVIHTRKTLHALRTYTQTVIGVCFIHGNGQTCACLTQG